jgi:predicted membrane protein
MKFVINFIRGFSVFFVCWVAIYELYKAIITITQSRSTVVSFILGGISAIIFCVCAIIIWRKFYYKRMWTSLTQTELRRSRRLEEDAMMQKFLSNVKNAKSKEQLDDYELQRKKNKLYIDQTYEEAGLIDD